METNGLKRQFETAKPLFGKAKVVRAVDGIDLKIMRGETFAIVGESGCGKSTLARLLVRLIAPSEGSVKYEGRNIADISEHEMRGLRRDLQFIFQDPFSSLNPRMSVGALIEEPLKVHGIGTAEERSAKVAWLLSRVGLSPQIADRYIHEFSGGQRQRIGIARALASGPKVLIGDEPVSALDVSIQAQVVNILEDLKQELGLTLVVIAHDLAVVRHMADRVAVMYLGEIVELAPVDELFTAPAPPLHRRADCRYSCRSGWRTASARQSLRAIRPTRSICRQDAGSIRGVPHATDLCRTTAPKLKPQGNGASVACHHADELDLAGLSALETSRSDAANKRFDLYRAARQRNEEPPLTKTSEDLKTNWEK